MSSKAQSNKVHMGHTARKRFGQNFLHDRYVIDQIVAAINPQPGDMLDPHQHQAMQAVESEQAPNTVVNVLKKGYALSDRVLRPAMVAVAKGGEEQA